MGGGNFNSGFASQTATAAERSAREAKTDVELMQHDIDRLLLVTEALWTFMKQQHGYTDDALAKVVGDIEARRGAGAAGIVKDPPVACAACGRVNTATRQFCIYCGKVLTGNPFAR